MLFVHIVEPKKWSEESAGLCCHSGKIKIPSLETPPEPLLTLLTSDLPSAKQFRDKIQVYNSAFQMTSFRATTVNRPGFNPSFIVQGKVYHRIGPAFPSDGQEPKFLQVYFLGMEEQVERRSGMFDGLTRSVLFELTHMLHGNNSYVNSFRTAFEQNIPSNYSLVIHDEQRNPNIHAGRLNAPRSDEVAVVMSTNFDCRRQIVLHPRNTGTSSAFSNICETHRSYDPLQYPLLFPFGQDGYHFGLKKCNPLTGLETSQKMTATELYAYRLMFKENDLNILFRAKRLFQQYIVDMFCKIESERLLWIKLNQEKLRRDEYIHLRDAVNNDGNANNVGRLTILPSTFTGSPRYMHEKAQDAMAFVRKFGRPHLFITMTCNSNWPEIKDNLLPGQSPHDRPDIICRVFHLKMKKLLQLINQKQIFGEVVCYVASVEWQKRGLPHVHILIWLKDGIAPDDIDKYVSAELPNPETSSVLYHLVKSNMIHGPCGVFNNSSPCMRDGKCTKRFPKTFTDSTQTDLDGYPKYRRRSPAQGGQTATINMRGRGQVEVDNRFVVPYNPFLLHIFKAHINVEICQSVKSIKYVCKYVTKGSDMAVFSVVDNQRYDEIESYQLGRYISSNEACWRIFGFPIHEREPTVVHLSVHLDGGQIVTFSTTNFEGQATEPPKTTLTEFFTLCNEDTFARTLLYNELPTYYTWNSGSRKWLRRRQGASHGSVAGVRMSKAIGRVYSVHPSKYETYCLRLLLHTVRGPLSYRDLRTLNGVLHSTFSEACKERGLLENDNHWHLAIGEALETRSGKKCRDLLAIILVTCHVSDPKGLWEAFKVELSEDILDNQRQRLNNPEVQCTSEIFDICLRALQEKVLKLSGNNLSDYGLPQPNEQSDDRLAKQYRWETSFDLSELEQFVQGREVTLNPDQKQAYDEIFLHLDDEQCITFLNAHGGTGKTYLINLVTSKVRLQGSIALATASCGIAATLFLRGRTAHSMFKLPLEILSDIEMTCNVRRGTITAKLLTDAKLIVWDECSAVHKQLAEALDKTMRDLRGNNRLFGGCFVLFAGDFRQTLPVIRRGTRADQYNASLKTSYLWQSVKVLRLNINMRAYLNGDYDSGTFASKLLDVGDGNLAKNINDEISITDELAGCVSSEYELVSSVYNDFEANYKSVDWLQRRAILAPRNDSVRRLNEMLMERIDGTTTEYVSVDTTIETEDTVNYPVEFLNSLTPPGIPPYSLNLKVGAIIMLLRNLDPPRLCNGTRLVVKSLNRNVIEAEIVSSGSFVGETTFIPRIPFIPTGYPFQFKRIQFPVAPSFAMSINKSQGQSFEYVGLLLREPCFSHGQLYVGCSRTGSSNNLKILCHGRLTKNIVYHEVLQ